MRPEFSSAWGRLFAPCLLVLGLVVAAEGLAAGPGVIDLSVGRVWTAQMQADFYSQDQGSRIMPRRWMIALKQPSGTPFLADSLSRYGYLPNPKSVAPGLPVGFTVGNYASEESIGMTCSACHTRQIIVNHQAYRIDGGPAIVDFQSFLTDLDTAVAVVLNDSSAFTAFAGEVLGPTASAEQLNLLRQQVTDWYLPYHTIVSGALPTPPWGPGRLDAVSMIFNRLSGLDIGAPPTYIIADNIKTANAPVRYPFLWNIPRQDKTQWPGFADNGDSVLNLARNLGEVTGVFAVFHPTRDDGRLLGINYVSQNSSNFEGLESLERMLDYLSPPKWQWGTNAAMVAQGSKIFAQTCATNCHEIKKGAFRTLARQSWATPVLNVGTDTREWSILARSVDPGTLTGASIRGFHEPLTNPEAPINVLGLAVVGSIIEHTVPLIAPSALRDQVDRANTALSSENKSLIGAFRNEAKTPVTGSYEARVLQGIWATAPYLHNGSVPTLAELLKPPTERIASFTIGPNYDIVNVGIAVEQTAFSQVLQTTDGSARDSGNCRCGHDFGTKLSASQKRALIEYLKTL